ncbi:MAG: thioredoxin family protein [Candidatus Marinimicrobia bacterium]|nr:thioredoxin family protein [Candidatus Neomarinimicrobiota bacterium]
MKKPALNPIAIVASFLFVTLLGSTPEIFMDLSFENAIIQAKEQNKIVLAKFHADWCHWCNKMDNTTFSDPDIVDKLQEFIPIKIDIEEGVGLKLAQDAGVSGLPTIVFFDGDGEVIGKYVGYQSPKEMKKIIKKVAKTQKWKNVKSYSH